MRGASERPAPANRLTKNSLVVLRRLFWLHRQRYGYRRIYEVARKEIPCDIHRVARLMRQDGMKVPQRHAYRNTTQSRHQRPVAPNLLRRVFTAAAPNQVWLADITYIPTEEGWLYLAAVLDLYARRVVGWGMAAHLADALTAKALKMALRARKPAAALLHHSDQGIKYASHSYRNMLLRNEARISMSRKGDAYDNAPMESFFATLKKELVHRDQYQTRREAHSRIFEYIAGYYNPLRIHSAIEYYAPAQYEALFVSP